MKCPRCGSENCYNNGTRRGVQQYKCKDCGKYFRGSEPQAIKRKNKNMGISIDDFRKKHDVNFIMSQVIEKFEDDTFYEKSDIIQMSGLRPGYPGMSVVLESDTFKNYSGRAGGKTYYAKPELIEKMKEEGILN